MKDLEAQARELLLALELGEDEVTAPLHWASAMRAASSFLRAAYDAGLKAAEEACKKQRHAWHRLADEAPNGEDHDTRVSCAVGARSCIAAISALRSPGGDGT